MKNDGSDSRTNQGEEMSERRRLKAGVEVEVFEDGSFLLRLDGKSYPFGDGGEQLRNLTEPVPEEPAEPKVGDEVTWEWLDSEWSRGRYHVVRNPDGSAGAWAASVPGANAVRHDGTEEQTWPLLALHPVKRWGLPDTTEPPLDVRMDCAEEFASDLERRIEELQRTIETLSPVTDGHRRDMADDIQRLHHAVHVELEDRIEALEARTANILADMPWLNPNPKEVMPDDAEPGGAGGRTPDVAPPPGADEDAPGGRGAEGDRGGVDRTRHSEGRGLRLAHRDPTRSGGPE